MSRDKVQQSLVIDGASKDVVSNSDCIAASGGTVDEK
jgi:hypothetical protein